MSVQASPGQGGWTTRQGIFSSWFSDLLAYASAIHFSFGSFSAINALGLTFFYYYPRTTKLTFVEPLIDTVVWIGSAVLISIVAILTSSRTRERPALLATAVLAIGFSIALLYAYLSKLSENLATFALFAVVSVEVILLMRDASSGKLSRGVIVRTLIFLLVILSTVEVSSATYYVMRAFDRDTGIGLIDAQTELQLSYVPYGALPLLYLGFLFSWACVPLVWKLKPTQNLAPEGSGTHSAGHGVLFTQSVSGKWFSAIQDPRIFGAIALALFVGYYPYFQNPPWLVGTDAYWRYYDPLLLINSPGGMGGFSQALRERHPVPLALLYAVQLTLGTTAFEVLRFAPLFLVVALALSTAWFLAHKKTLGFGLIVFIISVLSVTTTVGMYSSILANWMALLVWVLFFGYAARSAEKQFRILDFSVLFALSSFILFIHPWTWGVFAVSALVAAVLILAQERRKGLRAAGGLIFVICCGLILAYASLSLLSGSQGWRVADSIELYSYVLQSPSSMLVFWGALTSLTRIWAPFFSPVYLAVSMFGVLELVRSDLGSGRRALIVSWTIVSGLGSILVAPIGFDPSNPTGSETQLWRLLFLTPFQLTASFGIAKIAGYSSRWQQREAGVSNSQGLMWSFNGVWAVAILGYGILLSAAPTWARLLLLILGPGTLLVMLRTSKIEDRRILGGLVLFTFILVAFNGTTRALSQLLFDPHNYRPE